jgi:hypothetical protein
VISRRELLFALSAAALRPRAAGTQPSKTRLVLLGTGGGPRPRTSSSAAAQVILAGGAGSTVATAWRDSWCARTSRCRRCDTFS